MRVRRSMCLALLTLTLAPAARAQTYDADALPGVLGAPTAPRRVAVSGAGQAGYSANEPLAGGGVQHRLSGSVALGVVPIEGLGFALHAHGTWHTDDQGEDGFVGYPALTARAAIALTDEAAVGLDAELRLLGDSGPGLRLDATSLRARAFAAVATEALGGSLSLGVDWDNSAAAAPALDPYPLADRIALDVDATSSLVANLAGWWRATPVTMMVGASLEAWLGDGAPGATRWPWLAHVGAQVDLTEALQLDVRAQVRLSDTPSVAPSAPPYRVAPRLTVWLGLRGRWELADDPAPRDVPPEPPALGETDSRAVDPAPAMEPPAVTPEPAETPTEVGWLRLLVRDASGAPVSATVTVTRIDDPRIAEEHALDATGRTELTLPLGGYRVEVSAEGLEPQTRSVTIEVETVEILNLELVAR